MVSIAGGVLWLLVKALSDGDGAKKISKGQWCKKLPFQPESYKPNLVHVVNTEYDCRRLVNMLLRNCEAYPVLGFDCESVVIGAGPHQTAVILQLSDHTGLCAVIRINRIHSVPEELKTLLKNDNILKVGVSPELDAQKLSNDYGLFVNGFVDLRYASRLAGYSTCGGLDDMAADHLCVQMDTCVSKSRSKWNAEELSERQVSYAAQDAQIGFDLFAFYHAQSARNDPTMKTSFLYAMQQYRGRSFDINKIYH